MLLVAQDLGRIQETSHLERTRRWFKAAGLGLALSLHVALTDEVSGFPQVILCWFFRCDFRRITGGRTPRIPCLPTTWRVRWITG